MAASAIIGEMLIRSAFHPVDSPSDDFAAKTVKFSTVNKQQTVGWMAEGKDGCGTILLLHGLRGNGKQMLARAKYFNRLGYSVLLLDLLRHGEGSGN